MEERQSDQMLIFSFTLAVINSQEKSSQRVEKENFAALPDHALKSRAEKTDGVTIQFVSKDSHKKCIVFYNRFTNQALLLRAPVL